MRKSKKQTTQRLGAGIVDMIHAKKEGLPYKPGRKDGGMVTKPVVFVDKTKSEAMVLKECLTWLRSHQVGAKRMNVGSFDTGHGYRQFGIKGAGDIICVFAGLYIEIECKRGKGGVLSLNQQKHSLWVNLHAGSYFVVHGVEELEHFLVPIIKRHTPGNYCPLPRGECE